MPQHQSIYLAHLQLIDQLWNYKLVTTKNSPPCEWTLQPTYLLLSHHDRLTRHPAVRRFVCQFKSVVLVVSPSSSDGAIISEYIANCIVHLMLKITVSLFAEYVGNLTHIIVCGFIALG